VEPMRVRKSVGKEVTLAQDIDDPDRMLQILEQLAEQVERRLTELGLQGKTITLKLRWSDFRLMTRSLTVAGGVRDAHTMMPHLHSLLASLDLD
jgi:DNA polymerase IV